MSNANSNQDDLNFFLYEGNEYSYDLSKCSKNSKYLSKHKNEYKNKKRTNILNEKKSFNFPGAFINTFISLCSKEATAELINEDNVIILSYLAQKYEVPHLIADTNQFISDKYDNLMTQLFSIHYDPQDYRNDKYIEILSEHFPKYLQDDRLFKVPIPILRKSLALHFKNPDNQQKSKNIVNFLFKCLDKIGTKASILFTTLTFGNLNFLEKLNNDYFDVFDPQLLFTFNTIQSNKNNENNQELNELIDRIDQIETIINKISTNLEQIDQKHNGNRANLNRKLDSIKQEVDNNNASVNGKILSFDQCLKNQLEKINPSLDSKINSIDKKYAELQSKIDDINNSNNAKVKSIEDKIQKSQLNERQIVDELQQLKEKIDQLDGVVFDCLEATAFTENDDCCAFNKLDLETQMLIFDRLLAKNRNDRMIVDIHNLLQYLSDQHKKSRYSNDRGSSIFINNKKKQIGITHFMTQILFENKKLNKYDFRSRIDNFEDFWIETQYPSNDFKSISSFSGKNIHMKACITKINDNDQSMQGNNNVQFATIMTSVGRICDWFFHGCKSLKCVVIPSSVTEIGENAFYKCAHLKSIFIPSSVTIIGANCFAGCSSLEEVVIPPSITRIEDCTFTACISLKKVTIPSSVVFVGRYAFERCTKLEKIKIPHSVREIESHAFKDCSSLLEISLPLALTEIKEFTFDKCRSLRKVEIPDSVTLIQNNAFRDCESLRFVSIPKSVTKIGDRAFFNCKLIK